MNHADTIKPLFSVILAFRNESKFLDNCLRSFDEQTISRDRWEIILVDGCSDDGSREIAEDYVKKNENAKLLDNPKKVATAGWNMGVRESSGQYYYPASGHSENDKDYLLQAEEFFKGHPDVHALGGRVFKVGLDDISRAIAAASNTAFAMGGSYFRIATETKRVNVVGLGVYSKELYDSIGAYDDSFERCGDWEFNFRAFSQGFKMYIYPRMKVRLSGRSKYRSILLQQFRTGFWKAKVWAVHPRSLLPRHAVPSIFVLWMFSVPFSPILGQAFFAFWISPLPLYLLGAIFFTRKAVAENVKWYFVLPAYPVIHIGYGAGFLSGLFRWRRMFLEWFR